MSLEVIYVTRHGFRSGWSVDPLTGVYSASIRSPTGIPADPALTSHGVSQARELGEHLMNLDPPIDVVYSSPYYRCLQTITPFVELKQQQLQNEPGTKDTAPAVIRPEYGLCEFFGAAPFDHPIPASSKRLKASFPAYDENYVSALTPSRKGETIQDLYGRVAAAVQAIIDRCDAEGRRAVVLCTHAAVVIALGRVPHGPHTRKCRDGGFPSLHLWAERLPPAEHAELHNAWLWRIWIAYKRGEACGRMAELVSWAAMPSDCRFPTDSGRTPRSGGTNYCEHRTARVTRPPGPMVFGFQKGTNMWRMTEWRKDERRLNPRSAEDGRVMSD
ncbi:hypothetical protein NM208_g12173 [Fusarium decemcellulare]|uniref:Uncharacterized protein n=1 Tax=Fusarium decemcellulare TaxID=57161 RepID=A0ACC1RT86_9HYPO|nr:hypothetical protein NM208_g12173 [Fusarium decemcellulare]